MNIHDTVCQLNGSTSVIKRILDNTWLRDRIGGGGGEYASCYFEFCTGEKFALLHVAWTFNCCFRNALTIFFFFI